MKRKVGDKITVKSKYFNPFNDLDGVIVDIDDCYQQITVKMKNNDSLQVFMPNELKKKLI